MNSLQMLNDHEPIAGKEKILLRKRSKHVINAGLYVSHSLRFGFSISIENPASEVPSEDLSSPLSSDKTCCGFFRRNLADPISNGMGNRRRRGARATQTGINFFVDRAFSEKETTARLLVFDEVAG